MIVKLQVLPWLIGLIVLAGCSTDQTAEKPQAVEQGTAIAFSGGVQAEQAVTRATTGLEAHATSFIVYGYKNMSHDAGSYGDVQNVFPGYTVKWVENTAATTTSNSHEWEYVGQQFAGQVEQTIKYWDYGAYAYRFFGVTGGVSSHTAEQTDTECRIRFTANAEKETDERETPYYSHLWLRPISSPDIGKAVQLQFLKPFCRVRFMFTFEDPALAPNTELKDKRFYPSNNNTIKRKGPMTISYPLTGTATTETWSVSSDASGESALTQDYYESVSPAEGTVTSPYYGADRTSLSKWYTVLPATGQGTYTLEVSVNGEPKTTVVPADFMNWQPGYQYTYIFKVHVDGSVAIDNVQSAFTGWTDHDAERTVYNW